LEDVALNQSYKSSIIFRKVQKEVCQIKGLSTDQTTVFSHSVIWSGLSQLLELLGQWVFHGKDCS